MPVQTKHFVNTPTTLVSDSLQGLCVLHPDLVLDVQNKTLYLGSQDRSKVALLCGGGSGHEPAHAGYVGRGILTAAVCGNVFASPSASQVRRGIEGIDNDKGTLIIVKNYTGDVLNFGLAKEQYLALHPDKVNTVRFLVVADDVSVGKTQVSIVGRRGLAGTILVYKIAGALAEQGTNINDVYDAAEWVASNVGTVGVGLDHCHVPGTAPPTSYLEASEMEIGLGIHNEPGHRRVSPVPPLHELVPQLLDMITSTSDPERSFLPFSCQPEQDQVVLLVNNLGGLSDLELGVVLREAHLALSTRGIKVLRALSGTFMTSLNMPGFSITLLLLPSSNNQAFQFKTEHILSLLDAPADTPGWKWASRTAPCSEPSHVSSAPASETTSTMEMTAVLPAQIKISHLDSTLFKEKVQNACQALVDAEPEITRMDMIAGDGDCGLTLKAGARGVLTKVMRGDIYGSDLVRACIEISQVAEESMGGTSGALYSIFFSGLAQGLQIQSQTQVTLTSTSSTWPQALSHALSKLYTYTLARPPCSRTLVDPLAAFVDILSNGGGVESAVQAAAEAAEKTKDIPAKVGRSAYVEGDRLQVPDPGAWGVKVLLEALLL